MDRLRDQDTEGYVISPPPHEGYAVVKRGRVVSRHPKWRPEWNESDVRVYRIKDLERFGVRE